MVKSALGMLLSFSLFLPLATTAIAVEKTPTQNAKKAKSKVSAATKRSAPKSVQAKSKVSTKKASVSKKKASLASAKKSTTAKQSGSVVAHGKYRAGFQGVTYTPSARPEKLTAGDMAGLHATNDPLDLKSNAALVMDQENAEILFEKNSQIALPIASITKLMTALVVLEANQSMDELLTVTDDDIDREKNSHSRLRIGSQLTRADMLHIALMSSENRAASALGRYYPGGLRAFVAAMNAKAKALGMKSSQYVDSTGLSSGNVATARDLAKLVVAAYQHPMIRYYSTAEKHAVEPGGSALSYRNSNRLVTNPEWDIGLQKTGYISEAGRCLVMQAVIEGRPVVMVFLDSKGKQERLADAGRIRKWIETSKPAAIMRVTNMHQG